MPFERDFLTEFESQDYIVKVDNLEKPKDGEEVLKIQVSDHTPEEFRISTYRIKDEILEPIKILDLPESFRNSLSDTVKDELNRSFFANPYFDTVLLFLPLHVTTSSDRYKPIDCGQCQKANLYQKKEYVLNKSNYINKVQKMLAQDPNPDWPYKKKLLVQCFVSNIPAEVKRIDVDNLAKTILDSLQGVIYENDSQVIALSCEKGSILEQKSLLLAIRELNDSEKPLLQSYFYSGNSATWIEEERKKSAVNKKTFFKVIGNIDN